MSTFYSVRNKLEAQEIGNNDANNQFLASIISMYPCLDIWVRVADDLNLDVRVVYIQKNPGWVGSEPFERNNEEPKTWKQYQGPWDSIKQWFIGVLPELSQLHSAKRTGLRILGGKQPYEGGGMIVDKNDDGTISILGRFGVLTVTVDGVDIPFQDLAWDFEGCTLEVTVTPPAGWGFANINNRPTQNMTGQDTGLEAVPSVTLTWQMGVGGYRRPAGTLRLNSPPFLSTFVGYEEGTSHGPPTFLSPTYLPEFNDTPPGYDGQPNALMDSYFGALDQTVRIPLVDTTGDTETYSVLGTGLAGKWTRTHNTYIINATGFDATENNQGLAVLSGHFVEGVWTVTKTNNGANNHDWTWNFASNEAQGIGFGISAANNVPGNQLYMATNGNPVATDNGGAGQLSRALQADEGTDLISIGVPLDALSPGPGFVINGDRIPSTTVGQANAGGYVIQGSASYGALTIA